MDSRPPSGQSGSGLAANPGFAQALRPIRVSDWIAEGFDGTLVLSTIFPILDERFLHLQIRHALYEIWDMSCIAKGCPK